MTLDVYAHVLPTMGRGAAEKIGQLLHGQAANALLPNVAKRGSTS